LDRLDRLVAYVDGELDPDARAAFEAELAADATLRAEVEAVRRADGALGGLRSPSPADGFEDRLRASLAATLDEVLATGAPLGDEAGADADTEVAAGRVAAAPTSGVAAEAALDDELAARRRRTTVGRTPRWVQVTASAAAGVVVLAGGGLLLRGLVTGGDEDGALDVATMESGDMGGADDGDDDAMAQRLAPAGPEIVASERALDDDAIDGLLVSGVVEELVALGLDPLQGDELATDFQRQLGLPGGDAEELDADTADDAEMAEDESDEPSAADDDPVARCVAEVTRDAPSAIPAYVELATYDGLEVVVVGLVTVDPASGTYSRAEAWVLDRSTCQTLRFSQESAAAG
jgi:hypothetical protein